MFVYCKMLSIDEEELEKSEDLGIPAQPNWLPFGFHIKNVRMFYKLMDNDGASELVIVLNDFQEFTTDLSYDELREMIDSYYQEPKWIYQNN